jgi:citrate synthase
MDSTVHVTAREATKLLGIKRETLYAYVSRGLVRSIRGEGRERRYLRSDLETLKVRHDARAGHAAVAGGALRFGEPVLDSAITRIDPVLGPVYRGSPAIELVERGSFEHAASLLWGAPPERFTASRGAVASTLGNPAPLELLAVVVPLLAAHDPARFHATDDAEWARGRQLIARMTAALARGRRSVARAGSTAEALAIALGAKGRDAVRALDVALILCADHELNPSTFAARVAASAGADLYACVSAALATLSGPRHGGACDRVEALIAEIGSPANAARVIRERSRRGEEVPGFGHRLYPKGDPRATPLMDSAHAIAPRDPAIRTIIALTRAMRDAGREPATVDLGLVAITAALGLPRGSAVALFAIGRTAGWIAHVLEQRASDWVLRPRARYVGPPSPQQ